MQTDRKSLVSAAAMTATAGYVDAAGFLATGGFFVSFMSGNSTRAGIGLAEAPDAAMMALALIGSFLTGVIAATLLGKMSQRHRASRLLFLIALCLIASLLLLQQGWRMVGVAIIAFAMGAENLVFEKDGEVRFGITYMTGTLVKIGQRIGWALSGGPRWDWIRYAILWSAMIAGGACGALAFLRWQFDALWGPVGLLLLLALWLTGHDSAEGSKVPTGD